MDLAIESEMILVGPLWQVDGIDPLEFGAWLITSGLVMNDEVKWISFHSYYDFGYLIKLLTQEEIPQAESEFFEMLKLYFPVRACLHKKVG